MVERAVKDFMKQSDKYNIIKKYGFKEEKCVKGTMRRKPDFSLELPTRILYFEINPNQHKYYNKDDENNRLAEMASASLYYKNKESFFLLYNPNEHKDDNGNDCKSSINRENSEWIFDDEENIMRMDKVIERLEYWKDPKNKIPEKKYEKLYYDPDDDENNSETDDISDDNANYVHRQTKRRKINREEKKDSDKEVIDLTNDSDTENDEETNDNIFI